MSEQEAEARRALWPHEHSPKLEAALAKAERERDYWRAAATSLCSGKPVHVFHPDAKEGDKCLCGESTW